LGNIYIKYNWKFIRKMCPEREGRERKSDISCQIIRNGR